jgi:hypothetical protein
MALATTTLASAVTVDDNSIVVASATSVAAGRLVRVDDEYMQVAQNYVSGTTVPVLRGQQGSATRAHTADANVTHGLASDFTDAPAGSPVSVTLPTQRARRMTTYRASGAITLPLAGEDLIVVLTGTSTLTMTIAAPTKDLDGTLVWITGNAKSSSTIQFASTVGLNNAGSSYDIITLNNGGNTGVWVMAMNGFWNVFAAPAITGTTTAIGAAIA